MVENIGPIKNPLTVIAIFAGVAEISGTAVLPFVDPSLQGVYIWFLILFPTLLVVLFFLTLNLNHSVLYAPSDFQNEDNFLRLFREPTAQDRKEKLAAELRESEEDADTENIGPDQEASPNRGLAYHDPEQYRRIVKRDLRSTALLAEELAFSKIASDFDFDGEVRREVVLTGGNKRLMFDGVAFKGGRTYVIEIKYMKSRISIDRIREVIYSVELSLSDLSNPEKESFSLILVIVTDLDPEEVQRQIHSMRSEVDSYSFSVDVQVYNLGDLEEEVGFLNE